MAGRTLAVLVILSMVIISMPLLTPSLLSIAKTVLNQDISDFNNGIANKTSTEAEDVILAVEVNASNNWTKMANGSPSPFYRPAFEYDESHGEFVLLGRYFISDKDRPETWTYNSTKDIWTRKFPEKSPLDPGLSNGRSGTTGYKPMACAG